VQSGLDSTMIGAESETADACAASVSASVGEWLSFTAAPTFAILALLTYVSNGSAPDILCSAAHNASPLGGMAPMYLLMSAFHLTPWLKFLSGRQSRAGRL
jgi:hypothetical protein